MSRRQVSIFINGRSVENTLKGIRSEKTKINNELQNMTLGTEAYQKKAAELRKINGLLSDHYEGIKGTESAYDKLRKGAGQFLSIAAASFTAEAIISYGAELFRLGTEMAVLGEKAKVVFGEALPAVTLAAEENATAMGLTVGEYIDAAAAIGDLLVPMGFARQEAADISTNLVDLSGALAEWTGGQITAAEVTNILGKAVLGEREELKQLGIAINEADVQARLAEKGLKDLTGEMLQQAKAAATLELITEKSADAQAAYANNADTLVRKQAELRAQIQAVNERLATALIPTFSRLLDAALSVGNAIGMLSDGIGSATAAFDKQEAKVNDLESELVPLLDRYDELQGQSQLTKEEQDELGNIIQRIGEITPTAITEIDEYGKVLSINAGASREFLEAEKARLAFVNQEAIASLEKQIELLESQRDAQTRLVETGRAGALNIQASAETIDQAREKVVSLAAQIKGANAELARLRGDNLNQPEGEDTTDTPTQPPPLSPTPDEIAAQKERAKKLAEERARQAEQELKQRERLLQRLADTTQKFQEEARLAMMEEDEAQLERIRLQFEKQIAIAADLERQGMEQATALRIELERLQQEALQMARFEQNEALIEEEMAAISDQIDAELELEEEKTERILAEIDRRNDAERKKERERQAEEIAAQKKQFEEIATVAGATSSIISSALQLVGDEAARNTVQGKVLALIQIGLKTAEGIANAVAAGSGIPFPGNLPAIASGIAAVTTGIAGARQALQNTPAVPQRKEGGYVGVMGQDDGILYQARYVGRRKTGMITGGPALVDTVGGPVLANERGSEYFVNHRALQNPVVMDHVRAIDNIVRMRQFQAGGFTSPPSSPSEPASTGSALPVQELQQMTAAVQRLNGILSGGIVAVIDDDSVVDLRNRTQKLIDASGGVL